MLTRCACQWSGKYGKYDIVLSKWARCKLDPHVKGPAIKVLNRFFTAVDGRTFDPTGERAPLGAADHTLSALITEYKTHYVEEYGLTANSLNDMLNVLSKSPLGGRSLEQLAEGGKEITDWLREKGKQKKWSNKTWNEYRGLLSRVLKQGIEWDRLTVNPLQKIKEKVANQPDHFKQRYLVEDVEERLFAVVEQLNRAKHPCTATKGTEMKRRLIGAFYGGLRAGEMQRIQLSHVNWTLLRLEGEGEGSPTIAAYQIALPPELTKGGKTTGEIEYIYAATPEFRQVLEARRFQLKGKVPSCQFIFGTEDGRACKSFKKQWHRLFTLAELQWGRKVGVTWHTIRHEFISRLAELTKDPVLTQKIARHKQLETTQLYFHTRRDRELRAVASLGWRGGK